MTWLLLHVVFSAGLALGQAATALPQGPTEAPARLSSEEISQLTAKAEAGDAAAQLALGRAYEAGNDVPQSYEQAVKWYRAAAEQGNAAAQNDLGLMYLEGRGIERNKQEAFLWRLRSARQKYPTAMFNLGAQYYNGDGVAVDVIAAYAWFLLAQQAGSDSAALAVQRMSEDVPSGRTQQVFERIGDLYSDGIDFPKDNDEALKWYRKAAENGEFSAGVKVAMALIQKHDYDEARPLCEEAAKRKYAPGLFCVGLIHDLGLGVTQNQAEAAKWFRRAAELGHPVALLRLGEMYWKGTGVEQNRVTAFGFVYLAFQAGIPGSAQELVSWRKEMKPKDAEKAERKAIEWRKQHSEEWGNFGPVSPGHRPQPKKAN